MTLAPGSVARLVAAVLVAGAALFAQHSLPQNAAPTKGADGERITVDVRGRIEGVPAGKTARVTLVHDDGKRGQVLPIAETVAAADGTFAFDDVPWFRAYDWGSHRVLLLARCGDLVGLRMYRGEAFDPGKLKVALAPGIELRGQLRDRDTDVPIAGARVWPSILGPNYAVWLTGPLPPWVAWTDDKGNFTLRGVPNLQPIKLIAGGEHHARTWIDVEDPSEPVLGTLPVGGRIAGVVLLPDGNPAPDVHVTATGRGAGLGRAVTDANGRFVITELNPEVYKVFARVDGLTVIAVTGIEVEPGELDDGHTVQLVKGGFIVGKVVDAATGKPIPTKWYTDVAMYGPARGSGGSCECVPVQKDGTFRIRAPEGKNRIYLRGTDGYSEPTEWVDVVEGEETEVVWRVKKGK